MDGAVGAGCVHLRAAGHGHRRRRGAHVDAGHRRTSHRCVGRRLLEPDPVHDADVARHHHRARAGDVGADARRDQRHRRLAADAARRGGAGRVLCDGQLVVQLGLQPDLQRRAGARGRAPRAQRRLSRAGGGELHGARQHLGAGAERIGGTANGHARRPAASDPRHRRRRRHRARRHDPVHPDDLPVAEPGGGGDRDCRGDAGDVAGRSPGGTDEDRARSRRGPHRTRAGRRSRHAMCRPARGSSTR